MKQKYIKCDCGCHDHYIYLCFEEPFEDHADMGILYFTLTNNEWMTWWWKIKMIFKLIKNPLTSICGEVCFGSKQAKKLKSLLDEFIKNNEEANGE